MKFLSSKPFGLLLFILFISFSCKVEKTKDLEKEDDIRVENNDTITLSIKIDGPTKAGINVPNLYLNNDFIEFENKSNVSTSIIKLLPRLNRDLVFEYKAYVYNKGGFNVINQSFLIYKNIDTLNLNFDTKTSSFDTNKNDISQLFLSYKNIRGSILKRKETSRFILKQKLDSINSLYMKKYNYFENETLLNINAINYYDKLQLLYPENEEVDLFLKSLKEYTSTIVLNSLLFNYIKNRIDTVNYKRLNANNFSNKYLELLAIGHYSFLKSEDNKGDAKYNNAINWLKTTDLYKRDSIFIKKQIAPLNNIVFKEKIKNLKLTNTTNQKETLIKIIKKHPSEYYLIDFWATWCAPCISGVMKMKKMNFPKNVKVISISLDKEKDKQKWLVKTKKLEQSISYWLDEESDSAKLFLKFIELKSIPRYILIDKNMNLIDQAFYHPDKMQFLTKLKDVKNAKYW